MAGSSSANIALSFSPPRRSSLKMSATYLSYGELLVEILSWLPADSLLRFRFVCKSWFNLITHDSRLVKLQLLHHHSLQFDKCCPTILFSKRNFETIYSLSLKMDDNKLINPSQLGSEFVHSFEKLNPRNEDHKNVCTLEFVGSCNGLVCIKVYNCYAGYSCMESIDESIIYIWNPSTKEFKRIPDSPVECPLRPSSFTYGFGYDRKIDDYKVIRYVQHPRIADNYFEPCEYGYDVFDEEETGDYHDLGSEIKVYTLGTNSWRRIHQQIPYLITDCRLNRSNPAAAGLLVNGSLHWVTFCSFPLDPFCSFRLDRIISFDIVDEEYREVPKPDNLDHVELQELGGCLCLHYKIHLYHPELPPALCIWMMMDYGVKESWTKLFTINLSPFTIYHNHPMAINRYYRLITPLWLFKNGKILLGMCNKDLVLCSPESNEIEFLMNTEIPDFQRSKISYIGSLVSLKSGTDTNRTQVKPNEEDPEQTKGREDDREQTNN